MKSENGKSPSIATAPGSIKYTIWLWGKYTIWLWGKLNGAVAITDSATDGDGVNIIVGSSEVPMIVSPKSLNVIVRAAAGPAAIAAHRKVANKVTQLARVSITDSEN
jgi:hypothetical protein